ncbi:hypothetical protein [Leisingera thetidis]|uniref:hypothetical protein n=1 Tax=Leisingera thetidis TaxID=2930199 RepID=UPI0021F7C23C|nr:hypothetical protein [Leisingera thetidis]
MSSHVERIGLAAGPLLQGVFEGLACASSGGLYRGTPHAGLPQAQVNKTGRNDAHGSAQTMCVAGMSWGSRICFTVVVSGRFRSRILERSGGNAMLEMATAPMLRARAA